MGIKKLDTGLFKISFRKGTEVVKIDEDKLPKQYWVPQDPKPMGKTDLKNLLKKNPDITIDGVSIVRNPDTLQIK